MSQQISLYKLLNNDAIKDVGARLRTSLLREDINKRDYASLIELEYVETKESFLEAIKKFQRRYVSTVSQLEKKGKYLKKISENSLIELAKLVDEYGPKAIRAALIALALCKRSEQEE